MAANVLGTTSMLVLGCARLDQLARRSTTFEEDAITYSKFACAPLLAGLLLVSGCFLDADDDDSGGSCTTDCDHTHGMCTADCNKDNDSCVVACDGDRDSCVKDCD